jgi:hypothetical protein
MAGTLDLGFYYPAAAFLHIADYKNGTGLKDPAGNKQLILYAIGEADALIRAGQPVQRVRLTIIQPRRRDGKPAVQSVDMTIDGLWAWVPYFHECRVATDDPNALRTPGDAQCQWCRARDVCPERAQAAISGVTATNQLIIGEAHIPASVDMLTPEQISSCLDKLPLFEKWAKDLKAYGEKHVDVMPDWEMRPGNNRRVWRFGDVDTMAKLKNKGIAIKGYRYNALLPLTQVLGNIEDEDLRERVEKDLIETKANESKLTRVKQQLIIADKEPEQVEAFDCLA